MTERWTGRVGVRLRLAPHLLGAAAGVGAMCSLVTGLPPSIALLGVVVGVCAFGLALRCARTATALGCLAGLLLVAGWGWGTSRLQATTPPVVGSGHVAGLVTVDGQVQTTQRGRRVRVLATSLAGVPVPSGTRLLADLPVGAPPVRLGEIVRIQGSIRPAAGPTAPTWWRRYLTRTRIGGSLQLERVERAGRRGGLVGARDRVRNAATGAVGAGLSGEVRLVVRGMALGGGAGLSEQTADELRDAGIWHLLAVSGQNVAMVAIALLVTLQFLGCPRRAAVAVSLVGIVAYCLVCDGGASVVRAGIVGALGVVAELGARERQRWYLLVVAFTALVIHQPRALADPGLQLSFAAVAGLFTIAPAAGRWFAGTVPDRLAGYAAQAGAAGLATAPVLIWHFGELSLVGLLVNLVAVPLAAVIVVVALAGLGIGLVVSPLGLLAGWIAGGGAAVLLWLARVAAAVPGATVALPAWAAIPALVVVVAAAAWIGRLVAARGGVVGRRPSAGAVASWCAVAAALVAAAIPAADPVESWPAGPAVSALDVGQGDAILLRSPGGGAALFDTGPPGDPAPVIGALRRAGVRRLDLLALTHDQLDHSGAAAEIVAAFPVSLVASPVAITDLAPLQRQRGLRVRSLGAGDVLQAAGWRLDVVWPPADLSPPEDPNDAALVVVASAPNLTVLLTADAEAEPVLSRLRLPDVDVLKVAHHGSADPGLAALVDAVDPEVALISAGRGNRFGHPVPATVETLERSSVRVVRTDLDGTVGVLSGPGGMTVVGTGEE